MSQTETAFMITGAQVRGARGLLNLSVAALAENTGLAVNTIRRAEATNEEVPITRANALTLRRALEAAGIVFIEGRQHGPGVCLRDKQPHPRQSRRRD